MNERFKRKQFERNKTIGFIIGNFFDSTILWNYYGITRGISAMNRISNIFYDLSKIIVFVIFYLVLIKKDFRNIKFKIFMIIFSTISAISLIATQMSLGIDERILIFPLLFIITSFLVIKNFINFRKVNI